MYLLFAIDLMLFKKDHFEKSIEKYKKIAVSCSGGVDSSVLLHEIAKYKKNIEILILHFNYNLRDESKDDELFIKNYANSNNIAIEIYNFDLKKLSNTNIQNYARELRYEIFNKFIKKGFTIAIGHNLDDLAENVLLRLARGVSFSNIGGMSEFYKGYWRPLINTKKIDILNYAKLNNISYVNDFSNFKSVYKRNFIRLELIPKLNEIYNNVNEKLAIFAKDSLDVSNFFKEFIKKEFNIKKNTPIMINKIKYLTDGVIKEIISYYININLNKTIQIHQKELLKIIDNVRQNKKFAVHQLKKKIYLIIDSKKIYISKDKPQSSLKYFSKNLNRIFEKNLNFVLQDGIDIEYSLFKIDDFDNRNFYKLSSCGLKLSDVHLINFESLGKKKFRNNFIRSNNILSAINLKGYEKSDLILIKVDDKDFDLIYNGVLLNLNNNWN